MSWSPRAQRLIAIVRRRVSEPQEEAPMPKTIKVGVITQAEGAHLPDYFGSLAKIEEAEAVALADPSGRHRRPRPRKALGDKLKETYKDAAEMLTQFQPQLAVVSLEAALAPPAIDAALEAGCHVFAEKPSCTQAADFEKLVAQGPAEAPPPDAGACQPLARPGARGAPAHPGREARQGLRRRGAPRHRPDAAEERGLSQVVVLQQGPRRRRPADLARHPLARPGSCTSPA